MNKNSADKFILGINAYHGDSSACIIHDGKMIAGIEEERFTRIKHWAGFPSKAIEYCLHEAGIRPDQIDHVAFSRDPMAQIHKKLWFTLMKHPSPGFILDRLHNLSRFRRGKSDISSRLGMKPGMLKAQVHNIEHHLSHSSSAFFVSPFDEAAVVSIDAFGDFRSTMISKGNGNKLDLVSSVNFPHSLGLLYTAITQYLGFPYYGDEYKVMGLASYGKPAYIEEFRQMIKPHPGGEFRLNLDYFLHATSGVKMTWDNCSPEIGVAYSPYLEQRLGPARRPGEEITQKHKDLASSLQKRLEEIYFHVLNYAHDATGQKKLALAGGVAFNSVANGKIYDNTGFDEVYIQSAAGDAGTALGSAMYVQNNILKQPRKFVMTSSYWGPSYDDNIIKAALEKHKLKYSELPEDHLMSYTAEALSQGKIVGWFQGRVEWGPRALGNRSILCDPRREEMKSILNERIKRREDFRPFAPSILLEATDDYFEKSYADPFMLKVYPIKEDKRRVIPAVTHIDGTGRLQTVNKDDNPKYWRLIKAFQKITGVPVLLNTSFNDNEPIVCTPEEAIQCFLRANMDLLVISNYVVYPESYYNDLEKPDTSK